MSIQSSVNSMLNTGAAVATVQRQQKLQAQKAAEAAAKKRQLAADKAKREQARQEALQQKQSKQQQKTDFDDLKKQIKGWNTSLGPLESLDPKIRESIFKQTPELQAMVKKTMK